MFSLAWVNMIVECTQDSNSSVYTSAQRLDEKFYWILWVTVFMQAIDLISSLIPIFISFCFQFYTLMVNILVSNLHFCSRQVFLFLGRQKHWTCSPYPQHQVSMMSVTISLFRPSCPVKSLVDMHVCISGCSYSCSRTLLMLNLLSSISVYI